MDALMKPEERVAEPLRGYMIKKFLILILLLNVMTVLLCGCEGQNESRTEETVVNENRDIYEVSEFLDDAQYDAYMNDGGELFSRLQDFHHRMKNSGEFEFYTFANNFIEIINHEVPERCVVNYGTEYADESRYEMNGESITATEAIQVSDNFFTLFPLKISEGRSFEPADFDYLSTDTIPVIMGNAYRDSFRLGDTFEGYYICERRSFNVIGFTDSESDFHLRSNNCMVPYGRFIIMPFENIEEDTYSSRAILLQQTCGFISIHGSRDAALETIREYLTESGLENWQEAIVVNEKSLQEKMN